MIWQCNRSRPWSFYPTCDYAYTLPEYFTQCRYSPVTVNAMVSQITEESTVYSIVCLGWHQREHQSPCHWPFVRGIHRRRGDCFYVLTSQCDLIISAVFYIFIGQVAATEPGVISHTINWIQQSICWLICIAHFVWHFSFKGENSNCLELYWTHAKSNGISRHCHCGQRGFISSRKCTGNLWNVANSKTHFVLSNYFPRRFVAKWYYTLPFQCVT